LSAFWRRRRGSCAMVGGESCDEMSRWGGGGRSVARLLVPDMSRINEE
jgi:hypothetical protein